jgi:hypothetical protein
MRSKSVRSAVGVAVTCTLAAACSSNGVLEGRGEGPSLGVVSRAGPGDTGAVGLQLTIANGVHVYELPWTISNGTNSYSGTVNLIDDAGHEAQSVEFTAGGIVAGTGYVVRLGGADSSGDPCAGASGPFAVVAGATAGASVLVTCTVPTDASIPADVDNGSVAIDAAVTLQSQSPFVCPAIAGVSISPAELMPPETAALGAQIVGGDGGVPTVQWTSTCGTIANPTSASATFSCGAVTGTCTVTLTVGLDGTGLDGGSVGQVCTGIANTTTSETITCESQCNTASDCPAPATLCQVPACVANRCLVNSAPQGTACSDNSGSICNGAGTCVVPSFDVVRVGTGSALVAGQTAPVFVDRYTLGGIVQSTIPLPTAPSGSNLALTLIDNDAAEGDLTTSVDGRFVVMGGHDYVPGVTISAAKCVGALIDASGTVNTSIDVTSAVAGGGDVRSAASIDGNEIWVSGSATDTTGGLWYMPIPGTTTNQVQVVETSSTGPQPRWLRIATVAGGQQQLYGDSNTNPPGLFAVGSGTPTTSVAPSSLTLLSGLPTTAKASPYAFAFFNVGGVETLYVADDRTASGGGIAKFTLGSGGTWTNVWSIAGENPDGGTGVVGVRGLAGYATGNTVTLMASTGMPGDQPDQLIVIVDTGAGTPLPQIVATASSNETFRGIAVPPHP